VRRLFAALVIATTAIGATRLWAVFKVDGVTGLELGLLAVFAVLFAWISAAFWLVCIGAVAQWRGLTGGPPRTAAGGAPPQRTRTAVIMPVFNEPARRVFAGVQAMWESVRDAGALDRFDFFVLSDSDSPECWAAERAEWVRLRRTAGGRIFYRRRSDNAGRKSGNVAEFCRRWGGLYDYMVVLDADSLMTGETLVALSTRMDAQPRTALIQTLPALIGRGPLFAMVQQFVSRLYGPLFGAGLALLQGPDGNYWGHNAIIRVRAFAACCGLPRLPGRAPLGGEIMSHDFVEAALLRRAGWELWLAPDLGGSFEEAPGVIDYLKRDRRWCQGNLQHVRLIFARGLRFPSRVHLALGAMSYLSAPLWLLLLLLSAIETHAHRGGAPFAYSGRHPILALPIERTSDVVGLVAMMLALLFGPKLIALAAFSRDRRRVRATGGVGQAAAGVVLESVVSVLFAAVAMLSHCGFVLSVLAGRARPWTPPRRGQTRVERGAAGRLFAPHTAFAFGAIIAAGWWIPDAFWWLAPLLAGPALSIPFGEVMNHPGLARRVRRMGWLGASAEEPDIVRRVDSILAQGCDDSAGEGRGAPAVFGNRLPEGSGLAAEGAASGLRGVRRSVEAGSSTV